MPRIYRAIAIIALLAVFAIRPAPAQPVLTPVHVGVLPNGDMISLLYAQRNGMFAKAGLDVQIDRSSQNGSAVAAAVSAGAYDIGKGSVTAIMDAHLRGLPFVVIATATMYESKDPYVGLLVPKDSPVHSVTDLKSGIIGLSFLHDIGQLAIFKALNDAGGSTKDLQFTEVPMSAAMPAIDTHRVIGSEVADPLMSAALNTGRVRLIPILNTFGSSFSFAIWFTTKDYVAKNPTVVKSFAHVLAEAARYTNTHRSETAPMLSEYSKIPLDVLMHMPWVVNGTSIDVAGIQRMIDAGAKYGFLSRRFSASEIVDADLIKP